MSLEKEAADLAAAKKLSIELAIEDTKLLWKSPVMKAAKAYDKWNRTLWKRKGWAPADARFIQDLQLEWFKNHYSVKDVSNVVNKLLLHVTKRL
jgi:hypothetical protein